MNSRLPQGMMDPSAANRGQDNKVNTFDQQAQNLLNAYKIAYGQNFETSGSIPDGATVGAVREFLRQVGMSTDPAQQLPAIVGPATYDETPLPDGGWSYTRRKVKADAYMRQVIASKTQMLADLRAMRSQAGDLVTQAFLACVPTLPKSASEAAIADRKSDLAALLESKGASVFSASSAAQQVIHQAAREDDRLTLAVLLGPQMKFVRQKLGLSDATLQSVYFKDIMASIRANSSAETPEAADVMNGRAPAGAQFLALQQGPQRLANVVDLAASYFEYQLNATKKLLTGL